MNFEEFISKWRYTGPGCGSGSETGVVKGNVIKPVDAKSEGERWVRKYLEQDRGYRYYYDYEIEKTFDELGRLRFDFFIRSLKLCIEFDGDQHYVGSRFHPSRDSWVEAIQRDELKNKFCTEKGYSLIRIPQAFIRKPGKLKQLLNPLIDKLERGEVDRIYEVNWYFQWKAGKLIL